MVKQNLRLKAFIRKMLNEKEKASTYDIQDEYNKKYKKMTVTIMQVATTCQFMKGVKRVDDIQTNDTTNGTVHDRAVWGWE